MLDIKLGSKEECWERGHRWLEENKKRFGVRDKWWEDKTQLEANRKWFEENKKRFGISTSDSK